MTICNNVDQRGGEENDNEWDRVVSILINESKLNSKLNFGGRITFSRYGFSFVLITVCEIRTVFFIFFSIK